MISSPNPSLDRLRGADRVSSVVVRVYRADRHVATSEALVAGHQAVLSAYGIRKLVTFNTSWIGNPEVIVIAALADGGTRVLGGARMYRGATVDELPMYQAVGDQDPGMGRWFEPFGSEGAWELAGLWNSMELAGMGVEATYLVRAAMAAMPLVSARHLFALTSPVTRRMQAALGFGTEPEVGDGGFFTYPTDRLRATIARFTFPENLEDATPEVREQLREVWADPMGFEHAVDGPKGALRIRFELEL
jgi:hypothetical protein